MASDATSRRDRTKSKSSYISICYSVTNHYKLSAFEQHAFVSAHFCSAPRPAGVGRAAFSAGGSAEAESASELLQAAGGIHFLADNCGTWGPGFWPHHVLLHEAGKGHLWGRALRPFQFSRLEGSHRGVITRGWAVSRPARRTVQGRKGHAQPAGEGVVLLLHIFA